MNIAVTKQELAAVKKKAKGRKGSRGNPVNKRVAVHVGERLRERRAFMGYTQMTLAQELGLSHQQVQKYESGFNSVSAGKLYELGKVLGVEINYFFEGFDETLPAHAPTHGGVNRAAIEIAQNFNDITDQTMRTTLLLLVKGIAAQSRGEA